MKIIRLITDEFSCRIADAIFFGDKEYAPIKGNHEDGFKVEAKRNIDELEEADLANLYPSLIARNGKIVALAGETNWGGTGFVLLKEGKGKSIKWILHLSTMNNPTKVVIENDTVRVTTDLNFPAGVDFIIPMDDPMNFSVEMLTEPQT